LRHATTNPTTRAPGQRTYSSEFKLQVVPEAPPVGRDGRRLIGVVGMEPTGDGALLRSLAVRPTHQGGGAGTRLLEAMETQARRGDMETLHLLTTSAAPFFQRHGYVTMERDALPAAIQQTEEVARLCPASATCMRKSLGATEETRS